MDFWERFNAEIKTQKTTQEWIAKTANVNLATLRGWIAKDIFPRIPEAYHLAKALGVTVEYLVTGHDSTDPWLREHRAFIEDCKLLSVETFQAMQSTIQALADSERNKIKHA